MTTAPRLAYPLRLHAGGADGVEPDSLDDLVSTAFFALRTPPGWRPEAPDFGVADPVLALSPTDAILAQLEASDPRLVVTAEEHYEELTLRIRLLIEGTTE